MKLHPLQWLILFVCAGVGLWGLSELQYNHDSRQDSVRASVKAAEISQQDALMHSLATPDAFEAKCGKAAQRFHKLLAEDRLDPADASNPTTLIYHSGTAEIHVAFLPTATGPVFREHIAGRTYSPRPHEGLINLGCIKP